MIAKQSGPIIMPTLADARLMEESVAQAFTQMRNLLRQASTALRAIPRAAQTLTAVDGALAVLEHGVEILFASNVRLIRAIDRAGVGDRLLEALKKDES